MSAILLAAGLSRRFGGDRPKQLQSFAGQPLVRHMACLLGASRCGEVVVVTGHEAERVGAALGGLPVRRVFNGKFREGQASSVRVGVEAVATTHRGALFVPVDQPLLSVEVIDEVVAAFDRGPWPIVVPTHRGRRGAPVLFHRDFFPLLRALTGDSGGRSLLRDHEQQIHPVELPQADPLRDADTPTALAELEAEFLAHDPSR